MEIQLAFLGPTELVIILVLALLLFGPKNLPKIGQSLGEGLREFKSATSGKPEKAAKDEEGQEGS